MLHVWLIALFAVVMLRDQMHAPLGGEWLGLWATIAASVGPMVVVGSLVHAVVTLARRRLDATGSLRAVLLAERAVWTGRVAAVALYAFDVLVLGWLDAVRTLVGDLVLADELLAIAPPVAVIAAGWWSMYPIERSLREATLVRSLDEGHPVYPVPSRWQYVLLNVRHQMLLTLVPVTFVYGWLELVVRALDRAGRWAAHATAADSAHGVMGRLAGALADQQVRGAIATAGQIAGVVVVFVLAPVAMRFLWDTAPLGSGPIRDYLLRMCRQQRVRVRQLLVWRTHGTMINGAVMGVAGAVRYILLTDALLDSLPAEQVEAVMAHEVAHVKYHHMPWLALVMLVSVGAAAWAVGLVIAAVEWLVGAPVVGGDAPASLLAQAPEIAATGVSLAVGLVVFGYVSRRFEWQADAFAAKCLSSPAGISNPTEQAGSKSEGDGRATPDVEGIPAAPPSDGMHAPGPAGGTVTPHAAAAMSGALESVARLNHIPRHRKSWRHGSIAVRQERLMQLPGRPVDALPIDRTVRRIKRVTLGLALVMSAAMMWGAWAGWGTAG